MTVAALVECIERRRELLTVPCRNGLVAKVSGPLRRLIERIGFDAGRVAQAVRLAKAGKAS